MTTATINHTSRAHAVLSASAADRWMHCPPSARLAERYPQTSSSYAEEGTRAHEIAEQCLRAFKDGMPEPVYHGDDLRMHFAKRMIDSPSLSKATLNGERRYLSSFFTWLADNGYIPRNPMRAIKKMKEDKRIKKPFTQEEIELMRDELKNRVEKARNNRDRFVAIRMQALFEFMLSTGCRVSEASGAKLKDLNMTSNEILVFGKGAKERVCYLNEISIIRLKQWLEVRSEMSVDSEYLFTGYQNSYTDETQLGAGSIESYFRHLGNQLGIKCHPHKFRRTCATMALTKGMPIEEVQQMLGHNEINTTMIYAQVSQENVKHSHRKYM